MGCRAPLRGAVVAYNPVTTISITADERSVGFANYNNFPPVPVVGGNSPWNYWGPLVVTPEPGTLVLLGAGILGLLTLRRRSSG